MDTFGRSVAIQPGVALVGAPGLDESIILQETGAVYVFVEGKTANTWDLIRMIEDGSPGDFFGWSIALHKDNYAIIGACRGSQYGKFSGGAYYLFIETNPLSEQMLPVHVVPSERHGAAFFGFAVAVIQAEDSVRVAIGAYAHRSKGAVFIYHRSDDGSLGKEQIVYGSDQVGGDQFGWSLSMRGDLLLIGAPFDNLQGSAYLFRANNNGVYSEIIKLSQLTIEDDYLNPLKGDEYGLAVSIGDGYLAIASPHSDVKGTDTGSVYIYREVDNQWQFVQTIFSSDSWKYQRFGCSLSADPLSSRLVVGTDFTHLNSAGEVFIFAFKGEYTDGQPLLQQETKLLPLNEANDDVSNGVILEGTHAHYGGSVVVLGDYLAVGADMGNGGTYASGDVYFYRAFT